MKIPLILVAILAVAGCSTRASLDKHLNQAYRAYDQGDCEQVMLQLSLADRASRSRVYMQPEISMLRGQCLERQCYPDLPVHHQKFPSQRVFLPCSGPPGNPASVGSLPPGKTRSGHSIKALRGCFEGCNRHRQAGSDGC
jgi:hypothetical protein